MPKKISNIKTACAYIRVSTDKQEELSPDAQKRLLLDYAKKNNISILKEHIFVENGISGKKADKRPQFMQMIGMAKSKEHPFDIILVWKFSRFARNQEESIVYKSLLKKNNVEVVSVSEPLAEGPFGTLIERIIEWMDEYYSIRLSGEVTRGMTEKALRGGYQSTLPMGYKMNKETGIPQIDETAAATVRLIYNRYLSGRSYLEIARELNQMGLLTQRGFSYEERTIHYILENPFYYGVVRWNRQKHDDHTIRDKSEWIIAKGKHEAIISKEMWDEVQEQILIRSRPYKARSAGTMKHWLGGLVKCSDCGASLVAGLNATRYQCGNYSKGKCLHSHYIKTVDLEQAVYKAFKDVMSGGKLKFTLKRQAGDNNTDTRELINQQLKKLDDKERRIKQAYMDGVDSLDEYKENKSFIQTERDELTAALANIPKDTDNTSEMMSEISSVYDIITNESSDKIIRANAIRSVVDHMVYDKEKNTLEVFFYLVK